MDAAVRAVYGISLVRHLPHPKQQMRHLILAMLTAAATLAADQDPLRETFYVPFDGAPDATVARGSAEMYHGSINSYEPGVIGQAAHSAKRYTGIRFDGRGNIDLDRGSMAFFFKLLDEPTVGAWNQLAGVSTDIEGYWAGIIQFINKQNVNKETSFSLHFFDIGRYSPVLEMSPIYQRWQKDEWHHLALVWDRNEGVTVYEDGKRQVSNWGKGRWDWSPAPRMLVFGNWIYSSLTFAVDELHCYGACLSDEQVAQLAAGEQPTGPPLPITPAADRRQADLARMGWSEAEIELLPRLPAGRVLHQTQARIVKAIDAARTVAQPFEGLRESCWPLQKYGASTKGRQLVLYPEPGAAFDRIRIFAQRPFAGRLQELRPGLGPSTLAEVNASGPLWRHCFPELRHDASLLLEREYGQVGQIDLYRVEVVTELPTTALLRYQTAPLARLPATLSGRVALGDTPTRFDNPVAAQAAPAATTAVASPAFGGLQILSETLTEATAMDGVVVDLVVEGLQRPTPIRIVVKEPVSPQRDWLDAEAVLQPDGQQRQHFIFHLNGRTVVSMPQLEADEKLPSFGTDGREIAVLITAAEPVTWVLGDGGTSLAVATLDLATALPEAIADQTEFAREAYAEINEGHIWDNLPAPGWSRLYLPLRWLLHFAPDARPTMELAGRVGWRQENLPDDPPQQPADCPEWAFWQRQAMTDVWGVIHWIIDNRQTELGEFGGVWGDDTDMSEYWSDYALANDDDRKITNALRRFWAGVYAHTLVDGVSRTIRDNLHSYEEGMGAICHQLLVDYGDPIAIEHVMRAASHYHPKWMRQNDDGSYSFRSNYFGYGGVYTEGRFGEDTGVNYLMFYPAAYLVWYNRHPDSAKYLGHWQRGNEAPGLVYDAWLRLNEPDLAARRQAYTARIEATNPSREPIVVNAYLDELGMDPAWRDRFVDGAKRNQWNFFAGKLPKYAGYSPRMTEFFWLAYKASGDLAYLVQSYRQACSFVNNQRWLYTVAQPSTDRIPLPRTSVVRARLGALAVTRGASGAFWPRHAFSYVSGAAEVAALVTENTETAAAARFYCFADRPHALQLRTWRLQPGTYAVELRSDTDHDGAGEAVIASREMSLDRGAYIDLELPPRQSAVLTITARQTAAMVFDLPDPAVALADIVLEYGDHLHFQVHNVGVKPVTNLRVRVRDGHSGAVVGERIIDEIPAPLDLQPKTVLVELQNVNAITRGSIIIELDPEQERPDLNRHNNRVVFRY